MMLASASGVSTTRLSPYFSTRPVVARKTPPSRPTSRPSSMTRSSRPISSSSALLIASTMLRAGTAVEEPCPLPFQTLRRPGKDVVEEHLRPDRRLLLGPRDCAVELIAELVAELPVAVWIPQSKRGQVLDDPVDGIPLPRTLTLF